MAALRARGGIRPGFFRIEVIAPDAVEGDLAPLGIVQSAVAPVVVNPEDGEHAQHQQSVQDHMEGEIRRRDHAATSHEATAAPREIP